MEIKMKKRNQDGIVRVESSGRVMEIQINEDFMHPDKESISVCYRGRNSSGIIDFTPKEIDMIGKAVRGRLHLIKGLKTERIKR